MFCKFCFSIEKLLSRKEKKKKKKEMFDTRKCSDKKRCEPRERERRSREEDSTGKNYLQTRNDFVCK